MAHVSLAPTKWTARDVDGANKETFSGRNQTMGEIPGNNVR